jgi:hypothetical protein
MKQLLGLKITPDDVKQNKGREQGVNEMEKTRHDFGVITYLRQQVDTHHETRS